LNDPVDHIPVLVDEVVGLLVRSEGGIYLDGTLGLGGHAAAVLHAAGSGARLLGVDLDERSVEISVRRLAAFGNQVLIERADYSDLPERARRHGWIPADGILLDLGMSSYLLETSGRGFSFKKDEPLDMRFDVTGKLTAEDLLNTQSESQLTQIFRRYGEEPFATRIAKAVVNHRRSSPLASTRDLRDLIESRVPRKVNKVLARTFQAIRIAVNDELEKLQRTLPRLVDLLRPGGRLAVISFHSLEDRITKHTFRRLGGECVCPPRLPVCGCNPETRLRLVSRAVRPGPVEIRDNPRSRSAVLRVVERVPEEDERVEGRSIGGR